MASRSRTLRAAALVAVGTLAVHQIRYAVAYHDGGQADVGHAYLATVVPLVVVLVAIGLGAILRRLAAGALAPPARRSPLRVWALASASVLALHLSQECAEALLARGHVGLLASVFGHGAWAAALAAVGTGAVIAAALRGETEAALLRPLLGRRVRSRIVTASFDTVWAVETSLDPRGAMSACAPARAPPAASM